MQVLKWNQIKQILFPVLRSNTLDGDSSVLPETVHEPDCITITTKMYSCCSSIFGFYIVGTGIFHIEQCPKALSSLTRPQKKNILF